MSIFRTGGPVFNYPNRTICAALDDMRKAYATYNFATMASLIEEMQMLANRMEANLENGHDYAVARDNIKEAKIELSKLKNEVKLLTEIKESK